MHNLFQWAALMREDLIRKEILVGRRLIDQIREVNKDQRN
jgi:hypothetical protein